jgi:8-oxo-dGTP pyrophosphatase MutT (NUDIX family)
MTEISTGLPVRGSAKAVIVDPETMAVLVLRLSETERLARGIDEWHIPGGAKNGPNEPSRDAAYREVQEETGIARDKLEYMGALGVSEWDALYEGVPTHFAAEFLAFVLRESVGVEIDPEESSAAAWITENEMDDYPGLTPQARTYIPKAIELVRRRNG